MGTMRNVPDPGGAASVILGRMWKGAVVCIGSLCSLMACDASAPVLPTRVAMLQRALDTALFECADRVWPESAASYKEGQVLLVSVEAGTAYLWNDRRQAADGQPPRVSLIPTAALDPGWGATFNVGMLFGYPTLGVSLDDTARFDQATIDAGGPRWHDFAVAFTLHEAFHFIGSQSGWLAAGGAGTRSTPYPQIAQPRYLRAALASSLLEHVRGADDAALAAAAFWQDRFVTEHQTDAEAIRGTDINEGTAAYATIVGSALVQHGCAASEATLVQTMLAHLDEFVDVESFDGGFEPYQLGVLAGIGARLRGDRAAGWEARVELGETPVEVLVSDTAPAAQIDDATLTAGARTAVDASNLAIEAEVTPLLTRMASSDHVRLPIPPGWGVGAFSVAGFVNLVDEPGRPEVLLKLRATHRVPDGGPMITVLQQTVMEIPAPACGSSPEALRIATFPASGAVAASGQFTVNSAEVSFSDLPADLVQDAAGLTWMCPRIAASATAALIASPNRAPQRPLPPLDCARLRRHSTRSAP